MAKVEQKILYPGKQAGECYLACEKMVKNAGYTLFKKREVASLLICNGQVAGQPVSLTTASPFGFPTSVVLTLSSDTASEEQLTQEAARLTEMLNSLLS